MGPRIANPRKHFQFQISVPGLEPFLCQRCTLPQIDYEVASHGDAGYEVKTAGMKKVGGLTISKIKRAELYDGFFQQWGNDIMNTQTGGGLLPSEYKATIIVEEFSSDGFTVIERHVYVGCFPAKRNGVEFSRISSDNTMEEIEFSVDDEL